MSRLASRRTASKLPSSDSSKSAANSKPPSTLDQLTSELAGLRIADKKGRQRQASDSESSPEARKVQAMKAVNASSQSLSKFAQSGWKRSKPSSGTSLSDVKKCITEAMKALSYLRGLDEGNLDIEKSASSVVGKLISMEMFDESLSMLPDMHSRLNALVGPRTMKISPEPGQSHLLSISLPESTHLPGSSTLTLLSTYFLHVITVLLHHSSHIQAFISHFAGPSSLLAWAPRLHNAIDVKHLDTIMTRTYTTLVKSQPANLSPGVTFTLRCHALACLIYTSPQTVSPDTFWDQAVKYAGSLLKSASQGEDTVSLISGSFEDLISRVYIWKQEVSLTKSSQFIAFCECWTAVAKRAGKVEVMARVGEIISRAGAHPDPPIPLSHGAQASVVSPSNHRIAAAALCALLSQIEVTLQQGNGISPGAVVLVEKLILDLSNASYIWSSDVPSAELEAVGKVHRALERVRRTSIKLFEDAKLDVTLRDALKRLQSSIVDLMANTLSHDVTLDSYTQILDSLFVLARTTLDIRNAHTHGDAYDYLQRAATILDISGPPSSSTSVDRPNLLRCISGAFHNLAGILYNAERYGAAIRFLTRACELGTRALTWRREQVPRSGEKKEVDPSWRQLEEQLYRRWELLGVCHCKIGDHLAGYRAFLEAIRSFPFSATNLGPLSDKQSIATIFGTSGSLRQLAVLVDRATYMGTCELFIQAPQVSLLHAFDGDEHQDPRVKGALLEHQLASISPNRSKEGVLAVMRQLLRDLLNLYDAASMPMRRTRTLVQCLEVAYYDISTATFEQCAFASYAEVVESVQEMLGRQDVGNDHGLVHCKGMLQASAHAWAAIHAHRGAAPSQISQATFHANEACSALSTIIITASRKSFGSARKSSRKSSSVAIRRVSSPKVFKKLPSPKAPKKAPPKRTVPGKPMKVVSKIARMASSLQPNAVPQTPKARNTEEAPITLAAATTSPPKQRASEELLGLIDVLQAMSCMLGFIGLTLTKIRTLIALRRLTDSRSAYDALSDVYVSASTELAVEYVNLGKMKKAATIHRQVLNVVQTGRVSAVSRAKFFLRYAQALALCEDTSSSVEAYAQAMESSNEFPMDEKGMSSSQRIHMRVAQLEAAAMATRTFAVIQYSKADVPLALDNLLRSVRLYNRALESMARLSPSPGPSTPGDANPFEDTSQRASSPHEQAMERVNRHDVPPAIPSRRSVMKGSEWGVADGLFDTFFALVDAYSSRGSPREALFFAEQAHDLADSLNAPVYASRALARMGEILIYQGRYQEGFDNVSEAGKLLADMQCADVVDIDRLHAEWYTRTSPGQNAKDLYERAKSALEGLDRAYGAHDSGPRRSSLSMVAKERIVPVLFARLLGQYIWVLRDDDAVEKEALLDTFLSLPPSPLVKAEQAALVAKLTLHSVYGRFGMDMFLSSITESTIAVPMGMSHPEGVTPSLTHDIPGLLEKAAQMYWSELDLISTQGEVPKVRNAAVSLAMIQALQTSLGKSGVAASNILVNLLDATTAISLHREMLDVVRHKFDQLRPSNDLQWPSTERSTGAKVAVPRFSFDDTDGDSEDEAVEDQATKEYWEALRSHHQDQSLDLTTLSTSRSTELPPNWTIVHICITEDRSTLFITRQNCGPDQPKPLVFCVPMQGRRENDGDEDEEHLSFDDALNELSQIITLSDEGTRAAAHINRDDMVAREQWWKERKELDTRLKELLSNIEFCWLGAFKTILNGNPRLGADELKALGTQFERIFQTGLHLQDNPKPRSKGKKQKASAKPAHHYTIDDALLECFSTLSSKCRDEELEDLVYFILDLYQFHGVPVATAEVDVTQVVVDLRGVLEDHAQRTAQQKRSSPQKPRLGDDEHMFLILDKNLQGIPWESIPVLRGRSVSRIPSMQFLLDRVRFANMRRPGHSKKFVDPRQTYYVLNPSGDLTKTEGRFKDWLDEMKSDAGWDGVVGHRPSEQQFLDALSRNELFIYFGHGGGEQYARSHKIRHLKKCAATMLWGCSSGALKDMGDFDRVGTPYNYMLAGCPTLVANLWDVTDRDIDKFSQAVFDRLRLNSQDVKSWKSDDDEGCSLVTAVAEAREVCKLRYLTGAAAVVYGVPFYL